MVAKIPQDRQRRFAAVGGSHLVARRQEFPDRGPNRCGIVDDQDFAGAVVGSDAGIFFVGVGFQLSKFLILKIDQEYRRRAAPSSGKLRRFGATALWS